MNIQNLVNKFETVYLYQFTKGKKSQIPKYKFTSRAERASFTKEEFEFWKKAYMERYPNDQMTNMLSNGISFMVSKFPRSRDRAAVTP